MSYTPGDILVRGGVVTPDQLRRALVRRAQEGCSLGESLVRDGVITERALAHFYHKRLVLPLVDEKRLEAIPPAVLRMVPAEVAAEFRLVPFALDAEGALHVALADPSDTHAIEELGFFVDRFVMRTVATESMIGQALERHYGVRGSAATKPTTDAKATPAPARVTTSKRPATEPDLVLFPENADERAYDPFGARGKRPKADDVVVLTKKVRSEETPLPPPSPFEAEHTPPPEEPVLLTKKRRREHRDTLPGMQTVDLPPLAELRSATDRDEVARIVLDFAARFLGRAVLFVVRKETLQGFDARGGGLDRDSVEVLQIPLGAPSLFRDVVQSRLPYRGPLPSTPLTKVLARALELKAAAEIVLLPIAVRARVVGLVLGDRIERDLPEASLQALVYEAGLAYERILVQTRAVPKDPAR